MEIVYQMIKDCRHFEKFFCFLVGWNDRQLNEPACRVGTSEYEVIDRNIASTDASPLERLCTLLARVGECPWWRTCCLMINRRVAVARSPPFDFLTCAV